MLGLSRAEKVAIVALVVVLIVGYYVARWADPMRLLAAACYAC